MTSISEGLARAVILHDSSDIRFERFCNEIVGELEGGATIFSTSQSWDLGRDGRGKTATGVVYVCASLTDHADSKAIADVKRLASQTKNIGQLYFCSNQNMSEKKCAEIENGLRKLLPTNTNVTVLGCNQLTEFAINKAPQVLGKQYRAEIEESLAALTSGAADEKPEEQALRLALMTVGHDESRGIREELYRASILGILADGKSRTVGECCRDVAAAFRLSRNFPDETVATYLSIFVDQGIVESVNGRWLLTSAGRQHLTETNDIAVDNLLEGRRCIREKLEAELGQALNDDHYTRIWRIIQDKLAHLFYTRGQEMVSVVSRLLGEKVAKSASSAEQGGMFFLQELAAAVATTSSHPSQQGELHTAVVDIFSEHSGPAFDWLTSVCAAFIAICSLGMEATSGKALARLLSRMTLVFDTDVILSLLGDGEPDHDAVQAIVKRWRKLGGDVLVARPVLEEVAHHAWISEHDYDQVKNWLPGEPDERLRLIENALVRGFAELMANEKAKRNQWHKYIGQFRGSSEWDPAKVAEYLKHEHGMGELLPRSTEEEQLENDVRQHLQLTAHQKYSGHQLKIALDKARRDAQLYAGMIRQIKVLRARDAGSCCVLVSSARRLTETENKFSKSGEPQVVVSISTVIYMLSLVPEVSIGLTAMKSLLFDERVTRFSSDLERTVLRVLAKSEDVDMPWAKRGTLMREIRSRLINDAIRAGQGKNKQVDIAEIERNVVSGKSNKLAAQVVEEAIRSLALDTRTEKKNLQLQKTISQLESEIERLKAARRP